MKQQQADYIVLRDWGIRTLGVPCWGPNDKDCNIPGSTSRSPHLWKLQYHGPSSESYLDDAEDCEPHMRACIIFEIGLALEVNIIRTPIEYSTSCLEIGFVLFSEIEMKPASLNK